MLCAGTAALSGCSKRPLPDLVTGQESYFIAQNIRCEMRDDVRELILEGLASYGEDAEITYLTEVGEATEGAAEITARRYGEFVSHRYRSLRSAGIRTMVERYSAGQVAYDFEFDIEENNRTGGGIDILSVITRGTISTTVSGKLDAKRRNLRNFKVLDQFGELISNLPTARECRQLERRENMAYPISGKLNLREVLDTFISLNQSANLVGNDKASDVPRMADTITYTTTIQGGIKPELKLAPLGRDLQVAGANIDLWSQRVDIHKLILALTLPKRNVPVASQRSVLEEVAIQELERQRQREIDNEDHEVRRHLLNL